MNLGQKNGKIENILGSRADPVLDLITVDNVPISFQRYRYIALNKPPGILTSARDDRGRKTVLDLLGKTEIKISDAALDFQDPVKKIK